MRDVRPFLLVRARPSEAVRSEFEPWFRQVHLKDAAAIPGFARIEAGRTAAGTCLGVYTFEGAEAVASALASPQAAYARGTWEQWAPRLEELRIEIFAPLFPMAVYQSAN